MLKKWIQLLLLIIMVGCMPLEPIPTAPPEPPRVVGVSATNNTEVQITFSNPMDTAGLTTTQFSITWFDICGKESWTHPLEIEAIDWNTGKTSFQLETQPQIHTTYQLKIPDLTHQGGLPLAVEDTTFEFIGVATLNADNQDQDGISNFQEAEGWLVRTETDEGTQECLHVISDPNKEDTDGDGLNDGEEKMFETNPGNPDTDQDGLTDYLEVRVYFSDPCVRDTDGDGMIDGMEAKQYKTSPALSDTDGDGVSDFDELASGGRNPLLADLPKMSMDLYGNPVIELKVESNDQTQTYSQELVSNEDELVKTDTTATKLSIENTVKLHTEAEAGTSNWPPSFNAKLTTDTEFHQGFFHDTSTSFTNHSVQQSQQNYETWSLETVHYEDGKLSVAMKIVNQSELSFKVRDIQIVAYRLVGGSTLELIGVMTPDLTNWPEGGHTLDPGGDFIMTFTREGIGAEIMKELVRNPTGMLFEVGSYDIYKLDETGKVETHNYAMMGETVVQRTGVLVIDYGDGVINHYMVATNVERDKHGGSTGVTLGEILSQIIMVDYKTCESIQPEGESPTGFQALCSIKTVANFRCDDTEVENPRIGEIKGQLCIPKTNDHEFREAAATLCKSEQEDPTVEASLAEFCETNAFDPKVGEILVKLCDSEDTDPQVREVIGNLCILYKTEPQIRGFWLVGGSGSEFDPGHEKDFDQIVLKNGERIYLVYLQDSDGDQIFDREEYLLGTDKFNRDSDGDGLSDYEEAKIGWVVAPQGQESYTTFPDPRFYDTDKDFLSDASEMSNLTDPYKPDTDGDGKYDATDSNPLRPPCLDAQALSLAGWWDGSTTKDEATALNVEPKDSNDAVNNGTIYGSGIGYQYEGNAVFTFDPTSENGIRYITIPHAENLSPEHEYTIAARIFWEYDKFNQEVRTVLTKGVGHQATYAVSISKDGNIIHSLFRKAKQKDWECYDDNMFIDWCSDGLEKDKGFMDLQAVQELEQPIENQTWVNIVVTYHGEEMKLYLNGELVHIQSTIENYRTGKRGFTYWKWQRTTEYLLENSYDLWIGASPSDQDPILPFSGMLDDVQFFDRALTEDEVAQMHQLGVCLP